MQRSEETCPRGHSTGRLEPEHKPRAVYPKVGTLHSNTAHIPPALQWLIIRITQEMLSNYKTSVTVCIGLGGGPQKDMSKSQLPEPVNVTSPRKGSFWM